MQVWVSGLWELLRDQLRAAVEAEARSPKPNKNGEPKLPK
jgi:hypothetical protein